MTDTSKATPPPWRLGRSGCVVADEPIPEINGANEFEYYGGYLIAESVVMRNAALIVQAVNAYDDLVEALEQSRHYVECHHNLIKQRTNMREKWEDSERALQIIDAALAKAKAGVA